jgi:hypothetical protein
MNNNLFMKFMLRRPVRSVLLLLLVAVMSFVFIMNAVEFIVVQGELERLGGRYPPVGFITPLEHNVSDVTQAVHAIEGYRDLALTDWRRSVSGIMHNVKNLDIHGYTSDHAFGPRSYSNRGIHVSDILVIGEVLGVLAPTQVREDGENWPYYNFSIQIDTVFLGHHEFAQEGMIITINSRSPYADNMAEWAADMPIGERVLVRAFIDTDVQHDGVMHFYDIARRILILLRPLSIRPLLDTDEGPLWYHRLGPGEEMDFSDPKWAELVEETEITNINQSTVLVTGTKDMSLSGPVWQRFPYKLADGRWLDYDDHINRRPVLVICSELARYYGLKVGDMITIDLREALGAGIYTMGYITMAEKGLWRDVPTYETEFEIVGVYFNTGPPMPSYPNSVYIPDSLIPAHLGGQTLTNVQSPAYSFLLNSHGDREEFLSEFRDELAGMGFRVVLLNDVARGYWSAMVPLLQSRAIMTVVFGALLALALALTTFFYLRQGRREFAFKRALGVPRGAAVRRFLAPIAIIGCIGVVAGGIPAWYFALERAAAAIAIEPRWAWEEAVVFVPPSSLWLAGLCAAAFIVLLLMVFFGAVSMSGRPILLLLQGRSAGMRNSEFGIRNAEFGMRNSEFGIGDGVCGENNLFFPY